MKIATLLFFSLHAYAWHNVTKIESGFLFENIGSLQTQTSSWKIVSYINLTTYFSELAYVEELVVDIRNQCYLLKQSNETEVLCDKIVAEMANDIRELRENNKFFIPEKPRRQKRGAINIIGTALKFLFGTMDNSDAMYYQKHIHELEESRIKTSNIIENHTSILSSTFSKLNEIITHTNEQNRVIEELKNEIFVLNKSARKAEYFSRAHYLFDEAAAYIKIILDKVRADQQKLFDITTSAYRGLTHESIFDPHSLMEIMREISADLRGTMFPLPLMNSNLYKILSLGDLAAVYINNTLIFEITTPLITSEIFQIYKITSIPAEMSNSTYSYIMPVDEMLAVTENRGKYMYTNRIQLELNGKIIDKNHRLLKMSNPMYILHSRPSCETVCFIQGKIDDRLCRQQARLITEELWIQLEQPNTYVFILPKPTLVSLKCGSDETIIESLEGIGLLKTNSCEITTNYVILPPATQRKRDITMQIRSFNMTKLNIKQMEYENYYQPTAITAAKTIGFLDEKQLMRHVTETQTSSIGLITLISLAILGILTVGLYTWAVYICIRARKHVAKRKAKEQTNNVEEGKIFDETS